jgi:hypothetical protein
MRQNAQVAKATFDTVPREIRLIPDESANHPSSEHWQVAHTETSDHRAQRLCAVIASLSCVLLSLGCNVYDPSLLEHNPLGAGASDDGGVVGTGGGDLNAGGASIVSGGSLNAAGANAAGTGGAPATTSGGSGSASGGAGVSAGGTGGGSGSNGSAGATAVAGTGGTTEVGGNAAGGALNASISMIDDMEMPDQYIPSIDGRQGFWSLSNDHTAGGVQTPTTMVMSEIPGGRGASMYALHTTASGFTMSGAQVTVDINRKTARNTYDATPYSAVQFWAKVANATDKYVTFAMPDLHTDPGGGLCDKVANAGMCYDHFASALTLTTDWVEYTVPLASLEQAGWGNNGVTSLDVAQVYGIQFSWTTAAMDLWIDDIAFVKK